MKVFNPKTKNWDYKPGGLTSGQPWPAQDPEIIPPLKKIKK